MRVMQIPGASNLGVTTYRFLPVPKLWVIREFIANTRLKNYNSRPIMFIKEIAYNIKITIYRL